MVRVVLRVPDGHVLGKYVICSKNVVRLGPDLLSVPLHTPHAPVLQPLLVPWEEVQTHIHKTSRRLRLRCSFRLRQVVIEITGHQELGPVRSIPNGRYDSLCDQVVAEGDIAPHNMPPSPPRHQLEAGDVQTVEEEILNGEVLCLSVEDCTAAAMSAWRRHCRHLKALVSLVSCSTP